MSTAYDEWVLRRAQRESFRLAERVVAAEKERDEALARVEKLVGALRELDAWASRMPDAGFTSESPRWQWWHERPRVVDL